VARGILSRRGRERLKSTVWGGVWGLVIGGVIVAVASQLAVRHDLRLPQPEARAVETPAGSEFVRERPETDPALPSEETVPAADVAAVTPAVPDPADGSPSFDTSPAAAPAPAFADPGELSRPDVPRGADVTLTEREGLRPETAGAPEARAPLPPGADRPAEVSRDVPAPPPARSAAAPEAVAEASDLPPPVTAEESPVVAGAGPEPVGTVAPAALAEADAAAQPAPDAAPAPAPAPVAASVGAEGAGAPEEGAAPQPPAALADTPAAAPVPAAPRGEAPAAAPELARAEVAAPGEIAPGAPPDVATAATDAAPRLVVPDGVAPAAPETDPTIPENPRLADGGALPQRIGEADERLEIAQAPGAMPEVPSVGIGERVGTLPGARADAGTAPPLSAPAPAGATGRGALAEHRRPFEAAGDLARLAVVLLHEGGPVPDMAELPGEVSFAMDAGLDGAGEIAAAYRAAGREVVLIPSLPAGATPRDVEVALQANLSAIDEAVAVLDPGDAGFQNDRATVGQVVAVIAETGHGLITASRGLNTAQQIAGRFDVPAALVFDDLGAGTDAGAISRALDRAAFRARQEAGVIILGRADPATLEGLSGWLRGRNAQSLALAPVSAVLDPEGAAMDDAGDEQVEAGDTGLPRVRSLPGIDRN